MDSQDSMVNLDLTDSLDLTDNLDLTDSQVFLDLMAVKGDSPVVRQVSDKWVLTVDNKVSMADFPDNQECPVNQGCQDNQGCQVSKGYQDNQGVFPASFSPH